MLTDEIWRKVLHRPVCHWLLHWRSVEREAPAFETAAANDERVRLINAIHADFNRDNFRLLWI